MQIDNSPLRTQIQKANLSSMKLEPLQVVPENKPFQTLDASPTRFKSLTRQITTNSRGNLVDEIPRLDRKRSSLMNSVTSLKSATNSEKKHG
jgi:hypothetical protein